MEGAEEYSSKDSEEHEKGGLELNEKKSLFPSNSSIIAFEGDMYSYNAEIRTPGTTKEDFEQWLTEFQDISKTNWRMLLTSKAEGFKVVYKAKYRCHHNTHPKRSCKNPSPKHTGCLATLVVTINKQVKRNRSKDPLKNCLPTIISINYEHNHNILVADALKFLPVSPDIKTKLETLFHNHHSPAMALKIHQQDLMEEYGDHYYKISADSSICPNINQVYRLYYNIFNQEFGAKKNEIKDYLPEIMTKKEGNTKISSKVLNEKDFVVAGVTGLMERVHSVDLAGKLIFIDSSSNMDRYNSKVFVLMSDSSVGGLPIGFFLSTCETEEAIKTGLELLQEILPDNAFGGRGEIGPQIFMTDDCQAQINGLKKTFKMSEIFLCTFHVTQAVWRWLVDVNHGIDKINRRELFRLFKNLVYSQTEEDFDKNYKELKESPYCKENFKKYIDQQWLKKKEMWAHHYRTLKRNINTNNTVENAMKVLKDCVLDRTRAYNPVQLFKFIEKDFSDHYTRKIGSIINGKLSGFTHLRSFSNSTFKDLIYETVDETNFRVKNEESKKEYLVSLEPTTCSCSLGQSGAPCVHQHFVLLETNKTNSNMVPLNPKARAFYHWIAYGTDVDPGFYQALVGSNLDWGKDDHEHTTMITKPEILANPQEGSSSSFEQMVVENTEVTEDWTALRAGWCSVFDEMEAEKSSMDYKALKKAIEFCKKNSKSSVQSALLNMGKTFKSRKYQTKIHVQPTSVARRKVLCGSRRRVQSGRPVKTDHNYTLKKVKRPHSLNKCVQINVPLGH